MQRKIYSRMKTWDDSDDRKPLMIMGPRQVGKTYSATKFARENYGSYVLFNFQESIELHRIFDGDLDPRRLIKELSAYSQETINEDTLILFDEIQECGRAVTSLKYFREEMPEQPIITTGSLLGLIAGDSGQNGSDTSKRSFPVGTVEQIQMNPMDLEEYAWATGRKALTDSIRKHFYDMSEMPLHDSALELYREYLAVGGMPEAISSFVDTGDPNMVMAVQRGLNDSLIGDISKHAGSSDTVVRTLRAWNSMTSQLMKDNLKFQYGKIAKGGRSSQYSTSVDWLVAARMVNRVDMVTEPTAPPVGIREQFFLQTVHGGHRDAVLQGRGPIQDGGIGQSGGQIQRGDGGELCCPVPFSQWSEHILLEPRPEHGGGLPVPGCRRRGRSDRGQIR